jgi:hypothetical protein
VTAPATQKAPISPTCSDERASVFGSWSVGPDRADDRHLEAVEDPDEAERNDDEPVPPRPRQPIEALRDVRLDRRLLRGRQNVESPRSVTQR